MPPPSLAALTILDAGPAGQVRAAAQAGWRSVGLRLNPLLASDARVVGDAALEAELREALARTGLAVLEVGVFPILPDLDVAALEPIIAFSAAIGARFLVSPVEDHDIARRTATFRRLCDAAAAHDLTVLAEFNPYSACRTLEEAVALVEDTARPNAALVLDAFHLSRSGGHPRDLARVDPALLQLLHFCDATAFAPGARSVEELRAESRGARLYPGQGALWLDFLLDALPGDIPISVEAPAAADRGAAAADRARACLHATNAVLARRAEQ